METYASGKGSANPEEGDLGAQVRSMISRLYRRFRSQRPEGTLGDTALDVLTRLYKNGPLTLTQLSEHDQVAPAAMSQSVNRLTSAGYAIRTPDPNDRRKVLFSTTAQGAELALDARTQRNAWLDAQLAALGPDDQAAVARACVLLSNIAASE